jgi:hypothetical protein
MRRKASASHGEGLRYDGLSLAEKRTHSVGVRVGRGSSPAYKLVPRSARSDAGRAE